MQLQAGLEGLDQPQAPRDFDTYLGIGDLPGHWGPDPEG